MPSYAILGATGATGSNILKTLLASADNQINVYVRSRTKLLGLFPGLKSNDNVKIFEGRIDDIKLLSSCLDNVSAVFACVATNENIPSVRIAQDTAQTIVAAITSNLVQDPKMSVPTIIFLSSISLGRELETDTPAPAQWLVHTAFSNAYADLALAEKYLRLHSAWLPVTYIRPGGLVEDKARGHKISTKKQEGAFLSYADLASGMVEVAQSGGYEGKELSINPVGNETKIEWTNLHRMPRGLLWHFAPWLYRVSHSVGLVS
ncbi:MAG: hypothetical protein M1835_002757 [Candelina submexicana]|nr:MAG: hypothetical protein M1835_002757 [Candelina submexicana]